MKTNILEDFAATVDSKQRATEASQILSTTGTPATMMPIEGLNPTPSTIKDPKVSLPKKFDGS